MNKSPEHSRRARSSLKNALFGKRKESRIRVAIVRDGVVVLFAAGLLVFSAAARGTNLLLALGAFFVGFLGVDYAWGSAILKKLSVKRRLPDTIYAGKPFYVEIELDSAQMTTPAWAIVVEDEWDPEDSRFDVPEELKKLSQRRSRAKSQTPGTNGKKGKTQKGSARDNKARDKSDKKKKRESGSSGEIDDSAAICDDTLRPVVYFPSISKKKQLKEYYVGVMMRRGRRRLAALNVSTRFPCGFFRNMKRVQAHEEILILPRTGVLTDEWNAYAGSLTQETSVATSLTARAPDETVSIRDWRQGDSSRTIAWRATAKRNRLQTREFAKRRTRTVVIILDLYDPKAGEVGTRTRDPELWRRVEKAVSFTATLVNEWSTADSRLVFTINGVELDDLDSDAERSQAEEDAVNALQRDEWNEILGGSSTLRVMSRLAVAVETRDDRLGEALAAASSRAPRDAQIVVISIGGGRRLADAGSELRAESSYVIDGESPLDSGNARFIDVSSESFDKFFQLDLDFQESDFMAE